VADAEGEASRFSQLLAEYKRAPEVTRRRLYLDAMEDVYASSSKVLIDSSPGSNLIYLPVDKLLEQRKLSPAGTSQPGRNAAASAAAEASAASRDREDRRTREAR